MDSNTLHLSVSELMAHLLGFLARIHLTPLEFLPSSRLDLFGDLAISHPCKTTAFCCVCCWRQSASLMPWCLTERRAFEWGCITQSPLSLASGWAWPWEAMTGDWRAGGREYCISSLFSLCLVMSPAAATSVTPAKWPCLHRASNHSVLVTLFPLLCLPL